MKKTILLLGLLFTISSTFLACRDSGTEREDGEDQVNTDVFEDEAEEQDEFALNDANDDRMWDESEFSETYGVDLTEWDQGSDGSLDDTEFYTTTYSYVNANNDEFIDEEEWQTTSGMYDDYLGDRDFDAFDTNSDNMIGEAEWNEGFADSDWFTAFDENDDDLVDTTEWNRGLFNTWDADDDGFWDQNEYESYQTNMSS